ncbi:MAG: hypothetical protein MRZ79_16350 [Bacteroidia bacterium]|nr:hypothetical protein [Bacteroidia bacterium]
MSIITIISIAVGVLAVAGVLFVISDVRSHNQRKAEVTSRNRSMSHSLNQETEVA